MWDLLQVSISSSTKFSHPYEAILILNNDTIADANMVNNLCIGMQRFHLDISAPIIYRHHAVNKVWSSGQYYNCYTAFITSRPIRILPRNLFFLTGCCLLVRRNVFASAGLFDESFFMYGEDVDFCQRALIAGCSIGVVPDAVLYHKINASSVPASFFYEYHINLGHFLLSAKTLDTQRAVLTSIIIKYITLFFRAATRSLRFRTGGPLRGYMSAIRDLPMTSLMKRGITREGTRKS